MTAAAAPAEAAGRTRLGERARADVVVPLLAAYFVLAVLYAWQAWRREVPTIFTDELEMAQISRSIADTGMPGRRGESYTFTTLVPWLTAPGWWIRDVETAFATIKYAQTLVMTATIFPAYLLARTVVSRPWALFAAVAAVAAPALSYAPMLVEEPFAYPAATIAFWLLVRMGTRLTWPSFLLAAGACVLATLVRSQLIALFAVLAVPLLVLGWRSEAMRRYRTQWSGWDWAGAVALALGAVLFVMAWIGHRSADWAEMMALWKGRIVEYGIWAGGGFAIGVGILPLIAALAVLARPREEWRDPATRAYVLVSGAALGFLGFYAGLKGGYVSTKLGSYVVERNLIYLAPIVFVSTALLLERRNPRWWAVGGATAFVLYLVVDVPLRLDQYPYYEAHGLAVLAFANRVLTWAEPTIQAGLVVVALLSCAALVALGVLRSGRALAVLVAGVMGFTIGWNLLTEVYAANGERRLSDQLSANFVQPRDWVDRAARDGTVTMVGQQFVGPSGLWLTEFFNRSIKHVWSVDPTSAAPPPGPTVTADLAGPDGTMAPEPGTDYALAVNGVRLQGDVVASLPDGRTKLYRLDGPIRLAENQTGVAGDGWMGEHAAYNRFDVTGDGPGFARVTLSREAFCPLAADGSVVPLPGRMQIRIGPIGIGPDKQPALASVTEKRTIELQPCKATTQLFRNPPTGPWRIEVDGQTFVPSEVDPREQEHRALAARVDFGFLPL